jgi:hypothetical protein
MCVRVLQAAEGDTAAKREEVTGRWGKLHNKEFHKLYSSADSVLFCCSLCSMPLFHYAKWLYFALHLRGVAFKFPEWCIVTLASLFFHLKRLCVIVSFLIFV